MRILWPLILLVLIPASAYAQEEILFVFGSDTSTPGIQVDRYGAVYPRSGFDMFADPARQGHRIMDPQLRMRHRDSYGAPIKMTWWMQGGSLYGAALNTNVPLPSTMSTHLMVRHHAKAIEQFGDEMSFHYHTWVWSDVDGDGSYMWNQTRTFAEAREDFDRSLAEHLIEEDLFPVSFRSGWHYMDNLWQARLDSILPFSMHNAWPGVNDDRTEPVDNIYNWGRSPRNFVPYQPSADDYQLPGGSRGWNTGSRHLLGVSEGFVRTIFEAARNGERQVVCLWSHLAEADFVEQVEAAAETIASVAAEYPDVPFRYATGVEAMQHWLETEDLIPPEIEMQEVDRGDRVALRITSAEPLFQPVPIVALQDRFDRYRLLAVHPTGSLSWESESFDREDAAHAAVAVTDPSGNLTTRHLRYLPDDVYMDNGDTNYEEFAGSWTAAAGVADAQVWGSDYRLATLGATSASARWRPVILDEADYHVFVRIPDDALDAGGFSVAVRVNGDVMATTDFDTAPPPVEWAYAGTVMLRPEDDVAIEISAPVQEGKVLAADAIKLSARSHTRHLRIDEPVLHFGDVIVHDQTRETLVLRNTGMGTVTISDIRAGEISGSIPDSHLNDIIRSGADLPIQVGPMQRIDVPLIIQPNQQGFVSGNLVIESDDELQPVRQIRFEVRVMDYFTTVDDLDEAGYSEIGNWATSVTQAYGTRSRFAGRSPDAQATFTGTVERSGVYAWAYLVPFTENAAIRARYELFSEGQLVDSLIVDQNVGSGLWRMLGLHEMKDGAEFRMDVSWADLEQSGRVLRADAVRLFRLGRGLAERVIDNDDASDSDDADYVEEGNWSESVSSEHVGASSRWAPADGTARAIYRMRIARNGIHGVYQIVPEAKNSAEHAQYILKRNGMPVDAVTIDQNAGSGSWRFVTAAWFAKGDEAEVEVTHHGPAESNRVLRADAVRFVFGESEATSREVELPAAGYALGPNYPNPIRQTTSFSYELAHPAAVRIALYDVLGREVARLVDAPAAAGRHSLLFDASQLSSGVYFCRMESKDYHETRVWTVVR